MYMARVASYESITQDMFISLAPKGESARTVVEDKG